MIVIAVIALLAAAVFVAVDPVKRIGQAQDSQRWQDVTAIADAIKLYMADNNGNFPVDIITVEPHLSYEIMILGSTSLTGSSCAPDLLYGDPEIEPANGVLLSNLVPNYLPTMPVDPSGLNLGFNDEYGTGYYLNRNSSGKITIGACDKSDYTSEPIRAQR